MLTFEPLVLFLFGVDTNGYIAEDGLRTRGSHDGVFAGLLGYFVAKGIEFVMLVVIDYLLVGQGCLTLRVPVHHTQTAVDEAFLVQVAEHFDDGFGARLIHREGCPVPVARATELAQLFEDDTSVLVCPVPRVF